MIIPIVLHSTVVLLSFYLFILFAWWWRKQKRATAIYGYTCFLMLGIMMTHAGALLVYLTMTCWNKTNIEDFIPDWWSFRNFFVIVPLWLYAVYATKKIRHNHIAEQKLEEDETPKRRSGDFESDHFDPDRAKRIGDIK